MEKNNSSVNYALLLGIIILAGLYLVGRTPVVEVRRGEWPEDGSVLSGKYTFDTWGKFEEEGFPNLWTLQIILDCSTGEYVFLDGHAEGYIETGKLSVEGNMCVFQDSQYFESGTMQYDRLRISSTKGTLIEAVYRSERTMDWIR